MEGLERVAEDGNNSLISQQFLDFDPEQGGYTYVDNSGDTPQSALVRTGDQLDAFRKDATIGTAPLLPGQSATEVFELRTDGSNDFFSYVAMVLPTNDFFVANGNPEAHDVSEILAEGGEISFFIGTPNGGVNDAGTEAEDFASSAGNPLFPGRNLPAGQAGADQGTTTVEPIANVLGDAVADFLPSPQERRRVRFKIRALRNAIRRIQRFADHPDVAEIVEQLQSKIEELQASLIVDTDGLDFNLYNDGIARVTIKAVPIPDSDSFSLTVPRTLVNNADTFQQAALNGNLYFNIHTADFPGGEIRGQLDNVIADRTFPNGTRRITLGANLDAAQEPGGSSDSTATGEATVDVFISARGFVRYLSTLTVEGIPVESLIPVADFSAIHIHNAPRGQNGPVLQDAIVDAGGTATDFSVLQQSDSE
ncbi:MAG: spondin domain-containing protein [Planctomycetota bacterium]